MELGYEHIEKLFFEKPCKVSTVVLSKTYDEIALNLILGIIFLEMILFLASVTANEIFYWTNSILLEKN